MANDVKIFLGIIGGTLILIFGAAFLLGKGNVSPTGSSGSNIVDQKLLIKPDSWRIGSDSARVTIVEFSDFECPSCKAAQPVLQSILARYGNNIRLVYRHFPLPAHEFAFAAAQAAEAAGRQMKFWPYHDKLFAQSPNLPRDQLIATARQLNLDVAKFSADLDSDSTRQKVLDDQADGNALGVNATPTFFVNGKRLVGFDALETEVSSLLK